jgi:hypothetical protein
MSDDSVPDNVLFELYEEYIGEPDARADVYLGFGMFFAGIALATVGLLLFLWGGQFEYQTDAYWAWREPAYALGMMSLPSTLLGVIVLLPVDNRAIYSGAAGTAVTFLAVVAFALFYPNQWNVVGTDYSGPVVLVYGVGLAAVLSSTGAALVAHQISRYKPGPADIDPVEDEEPEESYSDEEIEQDIEDAMEDVDITWGGVEKHEGTSLSLNIDEESIDTSGMDVEAEKVVSSTSTDDQVQGLRAMKGGQQKKESSTSTVDDQTSKLTELRERKREEEQEAAEAAADEGIVHKFKRFLGMS